MPAVLAMVLLVMTLLLSAMGVVREKEIGTMEQLIVTPIRPWQLLVGKLAPFAIIGIIQVFLVTGVTIFGFGVPLRGSFLVLLGLSGLFLLSTLGLGLLVSTLVQNQQQAMMGAALALMMPMILLSGLIFPIENMPPAIQVDHLRHPPALLRRDHPRRLPPRLRPRGAVAAGGHPARDGPRDPDRGRPALPQAAGLSPRARSERDERARDLESLWKAGFVPPSPP